MTDPQHEYEKWIHEIRRQDAQRAHDSHDKFFSELNLSAIKTAELTLRLEMLINGGAAAAILAFIGGLITNNKIDGPALADVATSLTYFAGGVAFAVVGVAMAYLTHYAVLTTLNTYEKQWEHPYVKRARMTRLFEVLKGIVHVVAILAAIVSMYCFVEGLLVVKGAILKIHLAGG